MNGVIKCAVQEPPRRENTGVLNKNTGFPEPLSHNSNTTLPHPSADTSPTASIESADVPVSRTHTRHSSSFHLPHITSHNSHTPKERGKHQSINASANGLVGSGGRPSNGNTTPLLPNGNGGSDSVNRNLENMSGVNGSAAAGGAGGSASTAAPPTVRLGGEARGGDGGGDDREAYGERDEQGYREGERKKGLLRKLQLHKV